ncbi:uncharacterized protein involved in exopolysaccharide biosynthesis [Variovorax paradoxus]|nr:uncharacterized protein involved in exopolysaccharide biosynthesis [Variovorax paradoxus]
MNAHWQPALPAPSAPDAAASDTPPSRLREHVDLLLDSRWKIAGITAVALLLGAGYAMFGPRVYEANVLIQVEDADRSGGTLVGDSASNALNAKTPTAGEAEILKSRLVLDQAIENTKLYIEAQPMYVPLVGAWLARRAKTLSEPGFAGMSGYVSGNEQIVVAQMDVPADLEGKRFLLTAGANGAYTLTHPKLDKPITGAVGTPLDAQTPLGPIHLLVGSMSGLPGAAFELVRQSKQLVLLELQRDLRVIEKGKQSSVVEVSWRDGNRMQLANLLNEVAQLYVRVNIDQKTAQAQRALNFLGSELPKFKQQLEQSEEIYNQYRNQNGTVSLDDEARNALSQNLELQTKLFDATQKRIELSERFTARDPSVMTIDAQIASLRKAMGGVEQRIRRMPMLQQNSLRMQRDIKVNTDLYVSLLNSSLQMRLAKEGRIGNVRVLDQALLPEKPIRPKASIVMGIALIAGLSFGAGSAFLRRSWRKTIASPAEIETHTGPERLQHRDAQRAPAPARPRRPQRQARRAPAGRAASERPVAGGIAAAAHRAEVRHAQGIEQPDHDFERHAGRGQDLRVGQPRGRARLDRPARAADRCRSAAQQPGRHVRAEAPRRPVGADPGLHRIPERRPHGLARAPGRDDHGRAAHRPQRASGERRLCQGAREGIGTL